MVFNSYEFILYFLPIVVIGYFLVNKCNEKFSNWYLFLISIIFYINFDVTFIFIVGISILFNYMWARLIEVKQKKAYIVIGLIGNISLLFYFKYMNFFIQSASNFLRMDITSLNIILPVGISFFTFQQIAYLIDIYKHRISSFSLFDFALSTLYFPKIIQGPIMLHQDLITQFHKPENKKMNFDNIAVGFYSLIIGLAKKVLLADTLSQVVAVGFQDISSLNSLTSCLTILAYSLQLYFDFSGYCDMANGVSKMLNIDLPQNFNSPYKALTIDDFWSRWHMTLTSFFTRYVYIPLGGNRKGKARTYINVMIIFALSGIWHGANWTFVIWGILHGFFSVLTKMYYNKFKRLPNIIKWGITFAFINFGWIFFRAPDLQSALSMIASLFSFDFSITGLTSFFNAFAFPEFQFIFGLFHLEKLLPIFTIILFILCYVLVLCFKNVHENTLNFKPTYTKIMLFTILFVWSIVSLSNVTTFLYFNF